MGAKELPRVSQAYDNAFLIGSGMFQVCMMDFKRVDCRSFGISFCLPSGKLT